MVLDVLSALAEPTRLAAFSLLGDGGEHCVCELMRLTGASQSRMSRHMQMLKLAGLVKDRREAQWVRYRLNPDLPDEVRGIVSAILRSVASEQRAKTAEDLREGEEAVA